MKISKPILALTLFLAFLLGCKPAPAPTAVPPPDVSILFEDHFDGTELAPALWDFAPYSEFSTYSVEDNWLYLRSGLTTDGAARVDSIRRFVVEEHPLVFETALSMDSPTLGIWGFMGYGCAYFAALSGGPLQAIAGPGATIPSKRVPINDVDVTGQHVYRIELSSTEARFFVDDVLKAAIVMDIPAEAEMFVTLDREYGGSGELLSADYVRVSRSGTQVQADSQPQPETSQADTFLTPGRIIFQSNRNGDAEIYSINADGSDLTNLTNNPALDSYPAWSPDGQHIAFLSSRDGQSGVYLMDPDGGNQRFLSSAGAVNTDLAWSPDSTRLAFPVDGTNGQDIFVINIDGSAGRNITQNPGGYLSLSWSPDGGRIAFILQTRDNPAWRIFSIAPDGSDLQLLAEGATGPLWSPTGMQIVYTQDNNGDDIFLMNGDGSGKMQLTNAPDRDDNTFWSPDGNQIGFISRRTGDDELYLINRDGTNLRQLTTISVTGTGQDHDGSSWSPDGTRIAFMSKRDGNYEIYVINVDGTGLLRLTDDPGMDILPSWQPAGSSVPPADQEQSPAQPGVGSTGSVSPASARVNLAGGESQTLTFTLTTAELPPQKVDILFLFDVTGSMGEVLDSAKANGVQIMEILASSYSDVAFGVASFADFNASFEYGGRSFEYGSEDDYPWRLDLDPGTDIARAAEAINSLSILQGGDMPESTLTALVSSAEIGWRPQSRRIVVLFSDAPVHDPEFYLAAGGDNYGLDPGPDGVIGTGDDLRMEPAIQQLAEEGISVFTVYTSNEPESVVQYGFEALADGTGGRVFNLENASDLSRVLVDDLGASLQLTGVLAARASAENTRDLTVSILPERYTQVPGGESRQFSVQVSAAERILQPGTSQVQVIFLADENPVGSAEIRVELEKPGSSPLWWLTPVILLIAALLVYFRKPILAALRTGKRYLLIHRQGNRETRITLHDGFTIGSEAGCDLVLEEAGVEAKHARLRFSDGRWLIASPGGQENIGLRGQLVDAAVLQSGDAIRLGQARLEFRAEKGPREAGEQGPAGAMPSSRIRDRWVALWNALRGWFKGLGKLRWSGLTDLVKRLGRWPWVILAGVGLVAVILLLSQNRQAVPDVPVQEPTEPPVAIDTATPEGLTDLPLAYSPTPATVNMERVYVPGGSFEMGSEGGYEDNRPIHAVTLSDFWMDQTEVTNTMYTQCVAAGICQPPSEITSELPPTYLADPFYADYPVVQVSWYQAVAYCTWVGGRLPTEAEWEYAARGSEGRTYPWGEEEPTCNLAVFEPRGGHCRDFADHVGEHPDGATLSGIMDMAGNVSEWVSDWYGSYPDTAQENPQGPVDGRFKLIRGGAWDLHDNFQTAYNRNYASPDTSMNTVGFRCVYPLP